LTVPEGTDIRIKNRYGLVTASGMGDTDIINRNGEVRALDIRGALTVQNSYEDVIIENVLLDCRVESRQSTVSISEVRGDVSVSHHYGDLKLEGLGKGVVVDGTHIRIDGRRLAGPIEMDNSYEPITLADVGAVIIRGDNVPVFVTRASDRVDITDRYSQIELRDIRGDVKVEGRDLGLIASGLLAEKIRIDTSYRDVELQDFVGESEILVANGSLLLKPRSLLHPLAVKGRTCSVTLEWPDGDPVPIEAQARNGDIIWEMPEKPEVDISNGISVLKAFSGRPGPAVRIATTYADILIKKRP
jgi:hypothetical protein